MGFVWNVTTLGEVYFCDGTVGYFGRRAFLWRDLWLRWGEEHFVVGEWWLRWEKGNFVAGIGDYVGRRAFLWRDWWLRWKKSDQVERWLAKLGNGTSSKKTQKCDIVKRLKVAKVKQSLPVPNWPSPRLQGESGTVKIPSL